MPHICSQSLLLRDVLSFESKSKSKSKWQVGIGVRVGPQLLTKRMTIFVVIFEVERYLRHYAVFIRI
jgi:hypothetical protein